MKYKIRPKEFDRLIEGRLLLKQKEFCEVIGMASCVISRLKNKTHHQYAGVEMVRRIMASLPRDVSVDDVFIAFDE